MSFKRNPASTLSSAANAFSNGTQPPQIGPDSEPTLPDVPPQEPTPIDPDPYPDFRDVPPLRAID